MGWSDEAFRDANQVLGTDPNGIYVTGDLGYSDFQKLVAAGDYPKIGTYLHTAFPGSVVACVGEKNYQVRSMTAGSADVGVYLGSGTTSDPALVALLGGKYRPPSTVGTLAVPYITNDPAYRFYVNSDVTTNDYGTTLQSPSWMYPEDGNRMVPGTDPNHLGGDTWVADAAIRIMHNENWSGMFLNFGGIDKIGHMWGGGEADTVERYGWDPNSPQAQVHEPFIAKNADDQLGKLIAELKAEHVFDDTLIIVTADHGSTYAKHFFGNDYLNGGDYNWYYGNSVNDGNDYASGDPSTPPSPPIQKLIDETGNVAFSYQSTAIETWLTDYSMPQKIAAAKVMRTLPNVIATYVKSDSGGRYCLHSVNPAQMTWSEFVWWAKHGQELVNTMAWPGSADVVGLLKDNTSYGVIGDHGGAQQDVQRIPMVFYNPGLAAVKSCTPFRLVDIMPTMLRTMGLPADPAHPMDGNAYKLAVKCR